MNVSAAIALGEAELARVGLSGDGSGARDRDLTQRQVAGAAGRQNPDVNTIGGYLRLLHSTPATPTDAVPTLKPVPYS